MKIRANPWLKIFNSGFEKLLIKEKSMKINEEEKLFPDSTMPPWLAWAREIQALSQTGLTFSRDDYDAIRYHRLGEIAAEIIQNHAELPKDKIIDNFRIQPGYATPKIDVRGAVIRANKILLVQERSDEHWCMPGGWADVGDSPSDMVIRETMEESGFDVQPVKVIGIFDANRDGRPLEFYHAYKIVFLCELIGGAAQTSNETMGVDFFEFSNLPPLSWCRTNDRHLAEIQAHLKDSNRSAHFD